MNTASHVQISEPVAITPPPPPPAPAIDFSKVAHFYMTNVSIGCDPELFLVNSLNQVIGAEAVIPKTGIGMLALDGVQLEIHPSARVCRQESASEIALAMTALKSILNMMILKGKSIQVSLKQKVVIPDDTFELLSPEARELGCMPSFNAYHRNAKVNAKKDCKVRFAGGHLHLGANLGSRDDADNLAKLCDLIVGIPCVLLDRDPAAAERRTMYGRAGEYRLPTHGFEYRTLSNFWLAGYPLYSLVQAQMRQAYGIFQANADLYGQLASPREVLLSKVDWEKVEKAINTNDYNLAMEIFTTVNIPLLMSGSCDFSKGIFRNNIQNFLRLAAITGKNANYWEAVFSTPLNHWDQFHRFHYDVGKFPDGWEKFIEKY